MAAKQGPKYIQIKHAILRLIQEGKLQPGAQVQSISKIMDAFGVSKVTAVRALSELEVDGIVRREHGRGTFVAPSEGHNATLRSVMVVVPEMSNPFHVEIVGGLEKQLRERDVTVELTCTDCAVEAEQSALERLKSRPFTAGAVLIPTPVPHEVPVDPESRFPLVVIDYCPPNLEGRCVFISCDNYRGGYEAARHLTSLGHKRIGYIRHMYGSFDRMEGFRNGLRDFGVDLPGACILPRDLGQTVGPELLDLVREHNLSAIFAHNDMLAMQAMQVLRSNGYAIPGDISLIGYDNVAAAQYLEVPLTSVDQHEQDIGRKAAELIIEAADSKKAVFKPREIVFVPNIVVRASTGPPNSA